MDDIWIITIKYAYPSDKVVLKKKGLKREKNTPLRHRRVFSRTSRAALPSSRIGGFERHRTT